jgi:glycosyltransferase involved in cell wall biosynthesis
MRPIEEGFTTMRVCYLANEHPVDGRHAGGIATYLKTIAETLVQMGHHVDVVFCDHPITEQRILKINDVTIHMLSPKGVNTAFYRKLHRKYFGILRWLRVHGALAGYLGISKTVADYIEKNIDADVFECQEIGFLGYFLCKKKSNVVIRLHTPFAYVSRLNRIFSLKYLFIEYFERRTAAMSSGLSSPSASLARRISRRWRLKQTISVERLPFRLNTVAEDDSDVPPYKYVLYFGRIEIRKGVLLLARAIRRVRLEHQGIKFLLVGADTQYGARQNKSVTKKLLAVLGPAASEVTIMGARKHEQLYPLIRRAEFVVLPSLWENFPNACLESMALGKTVIAPSDTGFAEQFRDMESGILFKRKSHRDLARKILYCIENPALVREIGINAQKKVRDFEAVRMTTEMLKKYHETIGHLDGHDHLAASRPKSPPVVRWLGNVLRVAEAGQRDVAADVKHAVSTFDEDPGPQVTVIVPSFNEEDKIEGSIRSLIEQRTRVPYEIIVVDSSTDDTAKLVRREFPNVVLVSSQHRLSCGEAKNVGLRFARGNKILFTDADTRVPADWIEKMANHLDEFDAAGGPFLNGTPESLTGTLGYCLEFFRVLPKKTPVTSARYLTGGNSGYRRDTIKDRKFISGIGEDIAFTLELLREGKRAVYDSTIGVLHLNKVGFKNVFQYQVALGRGGYRYRKKLRYNSLIMKLPILAFAVPVPIVPVIIVRFLVNGDFREAALLSLFSPLAMLLYFFWACGFYLESRDS